MSEPTWPRDDHERELFTDWQYEVANGDTLMGFRDWMTVCKDERCECYGEPCYGCARGDHN